MGWLRKEQPATNCICTVHCERVGMQKLEPSFRRKVESTGELICMLNWAEMPLSVAERLRASAQVQRGTSAY
jgi:hypothetical protein